jgi:UPF0176 protein
MKNNFEVLLFYKYVDIADPEKLRRDQKDLCEKLKLKGRVIVSQEGINGTLEGTVENTEKYVKQMQKIKFFKDINFKKSKGTGLAFPKLSVKVRPEIVRLGVDGLNPNKVSGKYISAEQLNRWFEDSKEFYIVDMRNDYEYLGGFFEKSVFTGIHNFYDLPKVLPRIEHLKNKTVVTVCTGGVRCEKASGYLLTQGFEEVYQLENGIQTYIEKYPDSYFKGKLYVFDNRLTIGSGTVGRCKHCLKQSDNYVNCAYDICHYHYICCNACKDSETSLAFCKSECKDKYFSTKKYVR